MHSVAGTTDFFQYFDPFPGIFPSVAPEQLPSFDPKSIKSLEIKWFKIDGPNLTAELRLFPNLEVLHLDNVTIFNQLQPVPLPQLQELYINQLAEESQDQTSEFQIYRDGFSPYLASNFFFLNDLDNSTDFYENLAQTKLNISVWLQGSIAFSSDPGLREIRASLPKCRPLTENTTVTYEKVVLGVCNDLLPTSMSPTTTSLNIYLVNGVTTEFLSAMLPRLPNLQELFIEIAGWMNQSEIDLGDLPKSLRLLSISSIRLLTPPGIILPQVKEFYFGSENQYGWLSVKDTELDDVLLRNFPTVFPNVERVGIFELRFGRYTFLKNILKSSAHFIAVQGFRRAAAAGNDTGIVVEEDEAEVELLLKGFEIPDTSSFFVIERAGLGRGWTGRSMDGEEQITLRYKMLGWDGIDSWAKYVHVRQLIDSGFELG